MNEELTPFAEAVMQLHEMLEAGFTEDQALKFLAYWLMAIRGDE